MKLFTSLQMDPSALPKGHSKATESEHIFFRGLKIKLLNHLCPEVGIVGPYSSSIFNFLRKRHTVFREASKVIKSAKAE